MNENNKRVFWVFKLTKVYKRKIEQLIKLTTKLIDITLIETFKWQRIVKMCKMITFASFQDGSKAQWKVQTFSAHFRHLFLSLPFTNKKYFQSMFEVSINE